MKLLKNCGDRATNDHVFSLNEASSTTIRLHSLRMLDVGVPWESINNSDQEYRLLSPI